MLEMMVSQDGGIPNIMVLNNVGMSYLLKLH